MYNNEEKSSFGIGEQIFLFEKYVLMPHSEHNVIICVNHQKKFKQTRWSVIEKSLMQLKDRILSSGGDSERVFSEIKNCIQTYNPNIHCNFNLLADLCDPMLSSDLWRVDEVVCSIVDAALKIPNLFPEPLMLLRTSQNAELEITSEEVHSILANAFLCTFPKRNGHEQYKNYPRINFTELFDDSSNMGSNSWQSSARNSKLAKLKCFMNYFTRMQKASSSGVVVNTIIYERRALLTAELFHPNNLKQTFSVLHSLPSQSLSKRPGCLQVDFANKYVGGGTLGNGSAMEEIKFATCPALVVSQLFVECLGDRDVLLVHGFEQFNAYTGYGPTFEFQGDFKDENISDNHIVAMDANRYQRFETWKQFEKRNIEREINKCICAFKVPRDAKLPSRKIIESGKWGCGVFNGHPQLKCLIQWIAASLCDVPLELNTFGDTQLAEEMNHLANVMQTMKCKLGDIYPLILEYGRSLKHSRNNPDNLSLVEFILQKVSAQPENEPVSHSLELESRKIEPRITLPILQPGLKTFQETQTTIAIGPKENKTKMAPNYTLSSGLQAANENVIQETENPVLTSGRGIETSGESFKGTENFAETSEDIYVVINEQDKDIKEKPDYITRGSPNENMIARKEPLNTVGSIVDTEKTTARYLPNNVYVAHLFRFLRSCANAFYRMFLTLQNISKPSRKQCIQSSNIKNSQKTIPTNSFSTSKSKATKKLSPSTAFGGISKWGNSIWYYITRNRGRESIRRPSTSSESEYSDKD